MTVAPVALFHHSLRAGGAERVMCTLANTFAAKGVSTDMLVLDADGPLRSQLSPDVRLIEVGRSPPRSLSAVVRYLRTHHPCALMAALNQPNLTACVAHALSRSPCRLVLTQHTHLSNDAAQSPSGTARFFPALARSTFRHADAVVAVSEGIVGDLRMRLGLDPDKVSAIHNPFDIEEICRLAQEPVDHPWLGQREVPCLVSVGRPHPAKDFPTLLHAVRLLTTRRQVKLVVVGDGPLRSSLASLRDQLRLGGCVDFVGFKDNPYAWVRKADCFVMSSAWEGFGNVLVEALAVGTPCVSTDCESGPREILRHGEYGQLTPVGDPVSLAAAIERALDAPRDSAKLQQRAREFDAGVIADKYLKVLLDTP